MYVWQEQDGLRCRRTRDTTNREVTATAFLNSDRGITQLRVRMSMMHRQDVHGLFGPKFFVGQVMTR
jgi:hypothetical protein